MRSTIIRTIHRWIRFPFHRLNVQNVCWKNLAIDALSEAVFLIDQNLRIIYANNEACRSLGYTAAELVGMLPSDINPDFHTARLESIWQQTLRDGSCRFESHHRALDGELFPVEIKTSAIHSGNESIILILARAITERRMMERSLEEVRNRLQAIIQTIPDLVWIKDVEGSYVACNHAFECFYGFSEQQIVGKSDYELFKSSMADHFRYYDRLTLQNESLSVHEEWIRLPDSGTEALFETRKVPVYDRSGNPVAILGIGRDITSHRATEENLRRTLQLTESMINAMPDLLIEYDGNATYLNVWTQSEGFLAAPRSELIGRSVEEVLPAEAAATVRKAIEAADCNGSSFGYAIHIMDQAGKPQWFELSTSRIKQTASTDRRFLMISRCITHRKAMESELLKRESEFRTLVENSPDTIARYDLNCRRVYVNRALERTVQSQAPSLLGKTPVEYPGRGNAAEYEEEIRSVIRTGFPSEIELKWSGHEGRETCIYIRLTPEKDADGKVTSVLAIGRDISELNSYRQKILQMAFYDHLTSLPNRALFNDRLKQLITDASWHEHLAGVMIIDLDRFKEINDTLGHPSGDTLLKEAALRLATSIRDYDTVARLGGDEFAILLPKIRSGEDLGRIASKILTSLRRPFTLGEREVFVSASIGISVFPDDSVHPDDLVKNADSAMYSAKRSGRNDFRFYSRDLTMVANERLSIESDLHKAIKGLEFELHFQPKVSLISGQIIGSEALLRWNHPEKGMISPDRFIGIAEDSGLIEALTEWVIHAAFHAAAAWNRADNTLHKVGINLSARLFQSVDLLPTIHRLLEHTDCRGEWIELEITESLLLDDTEKAMQSLQTLRSKGFSIAIDDFGTGYSALSYLARFPIDTLKIDRSFINNVHRDRSSAELVKAILSIARSFDLLVVAEGVETQDQVDFLLEQQCHIAQGFLFSPAVPRKDFESMANLGY